MYFQDKEELFRYLVRGYVEQLLMVLEEALLLPSIRSSYALFLAF